MSSTAHTLLSTSPCASPTSRTTALAEIGRDARGALRPRDPQAARGRDRARERIEATFELGVHVSRRTTRHPMRRALACEVAHRRATVSARVRTRRAHARARHAAPALMPSFCRQRCPRVPRHVPQSIAPGHAAVNRADYGGSPTRQRAKPRHRSRDHRRLRPGTTTRRRRPRRSA